MAQMRALDTPDPFNDDFYYHNAMRRKQEKNRRDVLMGAEPHLTVRRPGVVGGLFFVGVVSFVPAWSVGNGMHAGGCWTGEIVTVERCL